MTPQRPCRQQGFTLIEALIVVALVGVLLTIAVPSFVSFTANQRVKSASFELYAALSFARSEAIKRRSEVTVRPASGTDWATGWTVSCVGCTPTPLRAQDALTAVAFSSSTTTTAVVYRRDGRLTSGPQFLLIKPAVANSVVKNRCIRVDLIGLAKSTEIRSDATCP